MNLSKLIPVESLRFIKASSATFTVMFDVYPDPSLTKEDFQLDEVKERITCLSNARVRYLQAEGVISSECSWLVAIRVVHKKQS